MNRDLPPIGAAEYYAVDAWADGLFAIEDGQVVARVDGTQAALSDIVARARQRGLSTPLLLRFPGILRARARALSEAFVSATNALGYDGDHRSIFPIKVNQRASVVGSLLAQGVELEVGSKPELLAALALSPAGNLIICNGYKDREYIRLALTGRQLGLDVKLVIEKSAELALILDEARALDVEPSLGVRLRLSSLGHGNWQNTGGDKAKFGLHAAQLLALIERLAACDRLSSLELLHFHMGSQISQLNDIERGLAEAGRYLESLAELGVEIRFVDVGGGLAVDYEGAMTRGDCSMNYPLSDYATAVVSAVAKASTHAGIAPPTILTESGRAMSAHHAVLVSDITAIESAVPTRTGARPSHPLLTQIEQLHGAASPPPERYAQLQHLHRLGQEAFLRERLDLGFRAWLDVLVYQGYQRLLTELDPRRRRHRQLLDALRDKLADKYFVNLSIFQSLPDIWAIDQVFPMLPLNGLATIPDNRGVLEDLTCDSDGRIDRFPQLGWVENTLALHSQPPPGYLLGVFLVGAYQETLGDRHNLFGTTDCADVELRATGAEIVGTQRGESAADLLTSVGYDARALKLALREKISAQLSNPQQRHDVEARFDRALSATTYFDADW